MKLTQMKLLNFRSFGEETIIDFDPITGLIGHNSAGKTAILSAIRILLGNLRLKKTDFHCKEEELLEPISMRIEGRFEFFEENEVDSNEGPKTSCIPNFFDTLTIENEDGNPFIRLVLEAEWTSGNSPEGQIDSNLYFITSPDDETQKIAMNSFYRSKLDVIYIPAIRNPYDQLNNAAGTILWRLLKQINWKKTDKINISKKIEELDSAISAQSGISLVEKAISDQWKIYHNDTRFSEAKIKFGSTDLNKILKKLEVEFSPGPQNRSYKIGELGDGLQSLFYFSLIDAFLKTEEAGLKELNQDISEDQRILNVSPPELTILLVEEPENHVNPQLLGNALSNLKSISKNANSQVIFSSHNTSVIKRIDPEELRHVQMDRNLGSSVVNKIILPQKSSDAYKYVKNAVEAYPELYFSSLVVLGEGESEEVLIPFFLNQKYPNLDAAGITIVPLGGRHVNHFWRLLEQLQIPYITLLDFDKERQGGGLGRIKYALNELVKIKPEIKNNQIKNQATVFSALSKDGTLEDFECEEWITFLQKYGIFYSYPLDIDYLMLENFKEDYIQTLELNEGPYIILKDKRIKIQNAKKRHLKTPEFLKRRDKSIRNTLKECGGSGDSYTNSQKDLMIWYDYFFLGKRGKPVTHMLALNHVFSKENVEAPEVFKDMILAIEQKLDGKPYE
ncbi:AAA family ATPase [Enterococcus faecalis]|uniref:AAA family ATPase n=1 Tax=Enterococcus faecalis TaxID=1351 RepID=UPI00192912E8|nr:AAA family ATPase [Enterococcus faecalis]MDN3139609.1 AAA family ATPase [Enterococcus faecalis]